MLIDIFLWVTQLLPSKEFDTANPLPGHEQVRISGLKTWVLSKTLLSLVKLLSSQSPNMFIH